MARISYVEEKDHPELAADIAKIKGARGGLINIYKLLLHSPTVTMTWFEHIGAIRWKTKLTPRLREIAIVRVAQAARYAYALNQHVPTIAVPDGVSLEECEALKDWRPSKFFNEAERATLTERLCCAFVFGRNASGGADNGNVGGPRFRFRNCQAGEVAQRLQINPCRIQQQGFVRQRRTGCFEMQTATHGYRNNFVSAAANNSVQSIHSSLVRSR